MAILHHCDARSMPIESGTVQTCVTSPPYYGLRDYGLPASIWGGDPGCTHEWGSTVVGRDHGTRNGKGAGSTLTGGRETYETVASHARSSSFFCSCGAWSGCLGLEPAPDLYVSHMVEVFREVRRCLKDDGTLWLNIGDSHAAGMSVQPGLKPKDLIGIPWILAFALRSDGWYLRSDIVWHKPNPMPESVTDRPTKAHEYVFLLSKSERYFYDADAIAEPVVKGAAGSRFDVGKTAVHQLNRASSVEREESVTRNRRTVWTVATQPTKEAHFATMPEALASLCILAGSREGDTVLDPFCGSGTVPMVAQRHGRKAIGCDLNEKYLNEIAMKRTAQQGLFGRAI